MVVESDYHLVQLLSVIAKITVDSQRLEGKKPGRVERDFTYQGYDAQNDKHQISSNAFKNRFRQTEVSH